MELGKNMVYYFICQKKNTIKFIDSKKATNFGEISPVNLSFVVSVKSTVEISQKFVAFSEYMNFTFLHNRFEKIFGLGGMRC